MNGYAAGQTTRRVVRIPATHPSEAMPSKLYTSKAGFHWDLGPRTLFAADLLHGIAERYSAVQCKIDFQRLTLRQTERYGALLRN
jgi:hypothetical protein